MHGRGAAAAAGSPQQPFRRRHRSCPSSYFASWAAMADEPREEELAATAPTPPLEQMDVLPAPLHWQDERRQPLSASSYLFIVVFLLIWILIALGRSPYHRRHMIPSSPSFETGRFSLLCIRSSSSLLAPYSTERSIPLLSHKVKHRPPWSLSHQSHSLTRLCFCSFNIYIFLMLLIEFISSRIFSTSMYRNHFIEIF